MRTVYGVPIIVIEIIKVHEITFDEKRIEFGLLCMKIEIQNLNEFIEIEYKIENGCGFMMIETRKKRLPSPEM